MTMGDMYSNIQRCVIEIEGVAGTMMIYGIGTASIMIIAEDNQQYVGIIHQCLLGNGQHDLFSVSQIQDKDGNKCNTNTNTDPNMDIGGIKFPLRLQDGLYELPYVPLTHNDPRLVSLPQVIITSNQPYNPVSIKKGHKVLWARRDMTAPQPYTHRIQKTLVMTFGDALAMESDKFRETTTRPKDVRTYKQHDVLDMAEMSTRWMGISDERLKETITISNGLSPTPGKVRVRRFPQGNMKRRKVPYMAKGKIEKHFQASIGEVLFTDTFQVDDDTYKYGQAYVDYRSTYGWIFPIKSRKDVGWTFSKLCADTLTPLLLIRDNISENIGGELMAVCLRRAVASGFICPYRPEMDYAEGYLGRMCAMCSYAMVWAGAPMFMWRWAIKAAVFINNITARYYSHEDVWATPHELIYGEPYEDASVVMPFGCAALILLEKHQQTKFLSRCIMVIFIHYATNHPTHTYAFYSPKTKRILYRQDAIFLVDVFPMRDARDKMGLTKDGELLVPYKAVRAPLSVRENGCVDVEFTEWIAPVLPSIEDHTTGGILPPEDLDSGNKRVVDRGGPTKCPDRSEFGPKSKVQVKMRQKNAKERTAVGPDAVRKHGFNKGDRISAEATLFDGTEAGSYSNNHPEKCYGRITSVRNGIAQIRWDEGGGLMPAKIQDIQHESAKSLQQTTMVLTSRHSNIQTQLDTSIDNDLQAAGLVGESFHDPDLGECVVTGIGSEGGTMIVYYKASNGQIHWEPMSQVRGFVNQNANNDTWTRMQQRRVAFAQQVRGISGTPDPPHKQVSVLVAAMQTRVRYNSTKTWNQRPMGQSVLRRILRSTASIFKYGVLVPKNDGEAEKSPEAVRWKAGRDVEWIRLQLIDTFDGSYTWARIQQEYPEYKKSDVGHAFYIYDYKHSGEHRVRLVFDGSQQSEATYDTTFAPTVRSDSVRLFHLLCVEYGHDIRQYDIPQAFLTSEVDCTIFLYPPKWNSEFPGQILLLKRMLYGAKQAAFLFYDRLQDFFTKLGFTCSDLDQCFFKRVEPDGSTTLMIVHVDDFRLGGTKKVLDALYIKLFETWKVTTCSGTRFLGMDVEYKQSEGWLKLSMTTYIAETIARFKEADTSTGFPYREIVGCLLWIANVQGTVMMRIKDLARHSNSFGALEYAAALRVLFRLDPNVGIIFRKGGAYREAVPQLTRQGGDSQQQTRVEGENADIEGNATKWISKQEYEEMDQSTTVKIKEEKVPTKVATTFRRPTTTSQRKNLKKKEVEKNKEGQTGGAVSSYERHKYNAEGTQLVSRENDTRRTLTAQSSSILALHKAITSSGSTSSILPFKERGDHKASVRRQGTPDTGFRRVGSGQEQSIMYGGSSRDGRGGSRGRVRPSADGGEGSSGHVSITSVSKPRESIMEVKDCAAKVKSTHSISENKDISFRIGEEGIVNEFGEKDLYRDEDDVSDDEEADKDRATTKQFRIVAYSDASFAVDEKAQSVSGWVIYLNGSPILFGSRRQTVVVDSSCSAEYVAASMCVKKIMELVNTLKFVGIHCERPYKMYTDSTACKHIAENPTRMGKVRHLAIRTHLVRCHISLGDIDLEWCTTESMVADVMTKIVSGAQDKRLAERFYNDLDQELMEQFTGEQVQSSDNGEMTMTLKNANSV